MSMASLERAILASAKTFLRNPKLRLKDILEWSTGEIKAQCAQEMLFQLDDPKVYVCVREEHDKRPPA